MPPASRPTAPVVVVMHDPAPTSTPDGKGVAATLGKALVEQDAKENSGVPTPAVDRVQEEVMTAISPDGRPPHRQSRLVEWKWFIMGASALALCGIAWAAISGITWPTFVFVAAAICVFLVGSIPTWGAGLLRGGEEREARKVAVIQALRDRPS